MTRRTGMHWFFATAILASVLAAPTESRAADVVVDNDDGAPGFTSTGSWLLSSATGYAGGTYRYASATNPATATWTPDLTFGGNYEVFAILITGANRTTDAPYTIRHADGETVVHVSQRGTSDQYFELIEISLGSYRFEAGTTGAVTLANNGATGSIVYIVDAVRFRLLEDQAPLIANVSRFPYYPAASEGVTVSGRVVDDVGLQSVNLIWSAQPSGASDVVAMMDDGLHNDGASSDSLFAAAIPGLAAGEQVEYRIEAVDSADHLTSSLIVSFEVGATPDATLMLNEFLASNSRGAADPDFQESGDWIEIVNLGPDVADLGFFALSDLPSSPARWTFPQGALLAPGEYLVVWADDHNVVGIAMHANFKLSAGGESLILYDLRNHRVADRVDFGPQITDVSLARIPDQTGPWIQTEKPTPGAANEYGKSGPPPVFSVPSGLYAAPFSVDIATTSATEVRYTLDGSAPDAASTLYTGPVMIGATACLRARAWYADLDPSPVASASYFLNPPADRAIPIMNIVIDPDDFNGPNGIYTNPDERGIEWERPAHVSVMSPDGAQTYEIETGVRIHGGYSRTSLDKKSYRFYFRSTYGPDRWLLPWLTQTPLQEGVQQLVLRSGANDTFLGGSTMLPTYIRDQLMRDWYTDLGQRAADGFFVALYINGAYEGLYNATERITDTFMEDTFGGEDWDIVKGSWDSTNKYFTEAVDGDLAAWNEFLEWYDNHDVATETDYAELLSRVDVDNYLDYFMLNIVCQNHDWPHNNWITTRRRNDPAARWTFHEWDGEWSVGLRPTGWQEDTLTWARGDNYYLQRQFTMPPLSLLFDGNDIDPNATVAINGILDKPEGRRAFIAAVEEALNFELHPSATLPDVDRYDALIQTEIPREAARWAADAGASASTLIGRWNTGMADTRAFLANRPAYIRTLISDFFGLGGTKTLTFAATGAGSGSLLVNGRLVTLPWTGVFFGGSVVALRPIPNPGSSFQAWEGLVPSTDAALDYTIQSTAPGEILVQFETGDGLPQPNDVIFNEYWVNDGGTVYPTLGNRAIEGDWVELMTIADGVDLRGWRMTTNHTLGEGGATSTGGSILFPNLAALESLSSGTIVLVIATTTPANDAAFPADELNPSAKRFVFYVGNGNLDVETNPGFAISTNNEAIALLAPGATSEFLDDIGIDFTAEGASVTPASFGIAEYGVAFVNPFEGIGDDDGAVFVNDPTGAFINDNGSDPNRSDFAAGPGGWIVDPPRDYTGDGAASPPAGLSAAFNGLTPGAPNRGQFPLSLPNSHGWVIH